MDYTSSPSVCQLLSNDVPTVSGADHEKLLNWFTQTPLGADGYIKTEFWNDKWNSKNCKIKTQEKVFDETKTGLEFLGCKEMVSECVCLQLASRCTECNQSMHA